MMEKIYKHINEIHLHVNFKNMEKIDPMEARPGMILITSGSLDAFLVVLTSEGTEDFINLETGKCDYFDSLFKQDVYLLDSQINLQPEILTYLKEL